MQNHTLEVFYTIDADNVLVKTVTDVNQPLFQFIK